MFNADDPSESRRHLIEQINDLNNKVVFMQGGCRAFSFGKNITSGQYVLPFSFKLPENIPGSFSLTTIDPKTKK